MPRIYAKALPAGAQLQPDGLTQFRFWGPSVPAISLEVNGRTFPMSSEPGGWHTVEAIAPAGTAYHFRLPSGLAVPDPLSRLQSGDVHDCSVVVDPLAYCWHNPNWAGRPWHEAIIYEAHVGVLGGFAAVQALLPELRDLGVTVIELMPIADFPGGRNWGYDGVLTYAPDTAYGTPTELKALVDAAHDLGMSMMLDVVYNHFGPDGNYLHAYAEPFFRSDISTPWGAAIDFRKPEVRAFFLQNALYWLTEYRFDGLRFDAVHAISEEDFLDELALACRQAVEPGRHVHLVLEHENNRAKLLREGPDAAGFDAQWSDDLHHCLHVLLTGEHEGYYEDFQDATALLARCLGEGFAYQGQPSPHLGRTRGEPSAYLPSTAFVVCLQNHDQIGNRAMGDRLTTLSDPAALRAAQTLLLLSPFIPLLFMGEEWGAHNPFLFFTSHNDDLAKLVREGRRAEFKHFSAFQDEERRALIPDPNAPTTFEASRPDRPDPATFRFIQALITARKKHVTPGIPGCVTAGVQVLGEGAVAANWRLGTGALLTLLVNLGPNSAEVSAPMGGVMFATEEGLDARVRSGILPARSALALLDVGGR